MLVYLWVHVVVNGQYQIGEYFSKGKIFIDAKKLDGKNGKNLWFIPERY